VFCDPKISQKCVVDGGIAPNPAGGAHVAPQTPVVGFARPHPTQRLRRYDRPSCTCHVDIRITCHDFGQSRQRISLSGMMDICRVRCVCTAAWLVKILLIWGVCDDVNIKSSSSEDESSEDESSEEDEKTAKAKVT